MEMCIRDRPWSYRILVPLMAAAFVVLGAFPAGTFPRDASVVALYVFYIVLALLGCAVLLAVVRNRELPANVASGLSLIHISLSPGGNRNAEHRAQTRAVIGGDPSFRSADDGGESPPVRFQISKKSSRISARGKSARLAVLSRCV